MVIDEEAARVEMVVPDDQLSLAIGRRGQNVRLASQLTGWSIDILTEDEESSRRVEEFNTQSKLFIEALDVEEVIAHLLVTEGFTSIEEVAFVPQEDLEAIEGFDESVAAELQARAREYLEVKREETRKALAEKGVAEDLIALEGIGDALLLKLAEHDVKTRDDLADLAHDEFEEMIPDSGMSAEEIDALIMRARAHWFEGEEGAKDAVDSDGLTATTDETSDTKDASASA